ncbi:MAG: outer membrane lipoprotein carrier protein LolA [Alphaproteobacteria bacterium]|nr:MAG: outer membrane lipoprotein carrier protein LolA [Alphaproteobacteria bacterium]
MTLTRRTLLASLAALALAGPARAEPLSLDDISAYLNGLKAVKTGFTQIDDDGMISTGTLYIRRPGRARFEYDPPNRALVMAGGGTLAIFDDKSNLPPEQYPLARTPLKLILGRNIDLSRANMVVAHRSDGTTTSVVAQDPERPELGTIELVFTGPPVELRQWIITSSDGSRTTVILGGLEEVEDLPAGLFSIQWAMEERGF